MFAMRGAAVLWMTFAAALSTALAQGHPPEIAASKMSTADGLRVSLVAAEPDVLQPILVKFDDRGRLWTIQYLQYPNPAGLERVSVDRWSRTEYDRVPEPPPLGPRGADRITILFDEDGDGRADRFQDFVDGLNLATGLEFGHGGVYVLQVPYLLFYPDRDRDDVPDGDPQVLLSGFGMEDAQSLANHLTWGPDGWLYGVNGSTTTCRIRGIEFQQGVWRYHPLRDEFELFSEGGSNSFGLTFDARGNLFQSTNGGPCLHALQGASYRKSFGKHGPLHNPYAYGFFETIDCDRVPGGPPTGGIICHSDAWPERFRGAFIAGNFLGHTVSSWKLQPRGASFLARFDQVVLDSHDTWFGATDVCLAPDGSLYVSDFCDERTAHPDPDANWDRSNGRLYRIAAVDAPPLAPFDLATLSSEELVDLLTHRNRWFADRARVELAARRDPAVLERLARMARSENAEVALQGLWGSAVSGGFTERLAAGLLRHSDDAVRMWTVRLLGDERQVSEHLSAQLAQLAMSESSPVVRCQLAASARRLPAEQGLPILAGLLQQNPRDDDSHVRWMIWWGVESHAATAPDALLQILGKRDAWEAPALRRQAELLVRRWAASRIAREADAAAQLLETAPDSCRVQAFAALGQGLDERSRPLGRVEQGDLFAAFAAPALPEETSTSSSAVTERLRNLVAAYWQESPEEADRLRLALLCDVERAEDRLQAIVEQAIASGRLPAAAFLQLTQERPTSGVVSLLRSALSLPGSTEAQLALVDLLGRQPDPGIAEALIARLGVVEQPVRERIFHHLFRRQASALMVLDEIDAGRLAPGEIALDQLRPLASFGAAEIDRRVRQHWGNISPGTPEEKLAEMRRLNNDLRAGGGDPAAGKAVYARVCGNCHFLFGEGGRIGPDLTSANRHDRDALLANIVDPSAVIRREYLSYSVATADGRAFSGLIAEQDAASLTLLDAKNQRERILRSDIEEMRESDQSLMPERLLNALSPQELRDLFQYLQQ